LIDDTLLRARVEIDDTVRLAGTPPAPTYGAPLIDEILRRAGDVMDETSRFCGIEQQPDPTTDKAIPGATYVS